MVESLLEVLRTSSKLGVTEILARLLLSFVLTSLVAVVYSRSYRGYGSPSQLALVLVLVALAVTGIIMAIGENLALSLGMVGALSIVRFRTAIKDHRDLAYIFWALAIGLVSGAGNYLLALVLTGVIGAVVVTLEALELFRTAARKHLLILTRAAEAGGEAGLSGVPPGALLRASVFHRERGVEESTFVVDFAGPEAVEACRRALLKDASVQHFQILGPEDAVLG